MFKIVGEAPLEVRVGVDCKNCRNLAEEGAVAMHPSLMDGKGSASLFFSEQDKTFMTCCPVCGDTNKDETSILESHTSCCECSHPITVKDIRENIPCTSCGEINNRVVAITKYYSRMAVQ